MKLKSQVVSDYSREIEYFLCSLEERGIAANQKAPLEPLDPLRLFLYLSPLFVFDAESQLQ